ncbi:alpha/beta hydrolase, partial [Pseudorhodoplanes sp.]|uniref:alpha/beta hydrolase n=1 Tax=Pseudorhodoplanes sp. TaxID=1934341 RepID=UPI003D0E40E1
LRVEDRIITRDGLSIPSRFYIPAAPKGLLVYFHGGGWVLGELDDFDSLMRELVHRSGCAILAADYRLAPEDRFPAALEDARAVIQWAAHVGIAELGLPKGIAVGGDSAGGNLATVCAAELSESSQIRLQLLFYPCVDSNFERDSYREYGNGYLLSGADMRWFFEQYAPSDKWSDPRISILRSQDLSRAAPAWIAVARHDVLADEIREYAQRLVAAGVPIKLRDYPDLMHGFARLYGVVDSANVALSEAAAAVGAAFDE